MSLRLVVLGQVPPALQQQLSVLASSMDLTVVGPFTDLRAGRTALSSPVPDIAVVGTTMSDGSGFSLVRELSSAQRPVSVIFVGSRDEEAVTAFELQATDFVLWPASAPRVSEALTRARRQVLQLALLRTADELQRLLGEATAAGGVDLGAVFKGRPAAASLWACSSQPVPGSAWRTPAAIPSKGARLAAMGWPSVGDAAWVARARAR